MKKKKKKAQTPDKPEKRVQPDKPPAESASPGRLSLTNKAQYSIAAVVSCITFLTYLSSLQNGFLDWDDPDYVVGNPHIRSFNLAFVKWAFLTFHDSNWHPLTWISHALDYAIWNLSPLGHHLSNNILHTANTFIVVLLVRRLLEIGRAWATRNKPFIFLDERGTLIAAGVTGLLFGLHPLHVESVTWVAERKDLLCALFFLLSIMMYTKYVSRIPVSFLPVCPASDGAPKEKNPSLKKDCGQVAVTEKKWYLLSLGFFVLALLSKPMAVSLPAVLLVIDWYPFQRIRSMKLFLSAFVDKLPFVALSFISAILTILAQKAGGAIQALETIPLSSRVLVAAKSLLSYLWKMVLPINLVPYYPYPTNISLLSIDYILSIVLVLGITAVCVFMAKKRHRLFLSVWGYYVLTLIPVLGIVQVGAQSMADRYSYLPSLGPFVVVGLLAAWGYKKINAIQRWAAPIKFFCVISAILVLISLLFLTLKQTQIWKDSFTLWTYVIDKEPEQVALAYNNLATVYQARNMIDKAVEQYLIAVKLKPDFAGAHFNLGHAYQARNIFDKATEQYLIAVKLKPDFTEAHFNLGTVYQARNIYDKATEQYLITLKIEPYYMDAHYNLGIIYCKQGRAQECTYELNAAYAIDHCKKGMAYAENGSFEMAIQELQTAIKLKSDLAEAHFNLGLVYYKMGQMANAQRELITGLKTKPDNQQARQLLQAISR